MTATYPIELTVNGRRRRLDVAAHHSLLDVLRDDLELTGAKECCLVGRVRRLHGPLGRPHRRFAAWFSRSRPTGATSLPSEGLAPEGRLGALQGAFLDRGAVQCGFCIPGQVVAADDLLRRTPHPTPAEVQEGLAGNLCRCGCYGQITDAVLAASEAMRR